MTQPRTGPFGPEGEFGQRVDDWMDRCAEAQYLAYMVRKYPDIFSEAFRAAMPKPLPPMPEP